MVMMEDMYLDPKIKAIISFIITDKLLMVMGKVDIGVIKSPLPAIIQMILVDHLVYLFLIIIYVEIGLIPDTLLHITILYYTFYTQFSLQNLF